MEIETIATFDGPAMNARERWMHRTVGRDDSGRLYFRDSGPSWTDKKWNPARDGATIESLAWDGAVQS